MNRWHSKKIPIRNEAESKPVRIIHDALVGTVGTGEGRMIPLLTIDNTEREDIKSFVENHKYYAMGDISSSWGKKRFNNNVILLIIQVAPPLNCTIIFNFDIKKYGIIIDQIVLAQGLYIQTGREEENNKKRVIEEEKVLLEIPTDNFRAEWNKIYFEYLKKQYRRKGASKIESEKAAMLHIEEARKIEKFRMGSFG